jgi:hypothetical protein
MLPPVSALPPVPPVSPVAGAPLTPAAVVPPGDEPASADEPALPRIIPALPALATGGALLLEQATELANKHPIAVEKSDRLVKIEVKGRRMASSLAIHAVEHISFLALPLKLLES